MKVKDYESFVSNNAFMPMSNVEYSYFGLAGEVGEVMEWFKKSYYRKNPKFTKDLLKSELGDVLHYVTRITLQNGWTLKQLMDYNVEKLELRDGKPKE